MTLNDFLKRVCDSDKDKMMIFTDGRGWSNIEVKVSDTAIVIRPDYNMPFDD